MWLALRRTDVARVELDQDWGSRARSGGVRQATNRPAASLHRGEGCRGFLHVTMRPFRSRQGLSLAGAEPLMTSDKVATAEKMVRLSILVLS